MRRCRGRGEGNLGAIRRECEEEDKDEGVEARVKGAGLSFCPSKLE